MPLHGFMALFQEEDTVAAVGANTNNNSTLQELHVFDPVRQRGQGDDQGQDLGGLLNVIPKITAPYLHMELDIANVAVVSTFSKNTKDSPFVRQWYLSLRYSTTSFGF
jgi:hypothetical protein